MKILILAVIVFVLLVAPTIRYAFRRITRKNRIQECYDILERIGSVDPAGYDGALKDCIRLDDLMKRRGIQQRELGIPSMWSVFSSGRDCFCRYMGSHLALQEQLQIKGDELKECKKRFARLEVELAAFDKRFSLTIGTAWLSGAAQTA